MKTRSRSIPQTATRSAIAMAVATALGMPAVAQENELEEVVVTATRREASLQEIPLSVTAISGDLIAELQMVNVRDLDKTVPGLKVRYSGADPTIIMRGAGAAGTNDIAVPVYVDGLYRPRAGQGLAGYLDVDRIEVLRGPQGTLFGRNTFGGLVNIISNQPDTKDFDFGVGATFGDYSLQKFEGFINVPMGDMLALRVAASDTKRDPYIENVFNPDGGMRDEDNTYVRAQLRFEPVESFDVTLGYTYWKDTSNGNSDYAGVILGIPVNPQTGLTDGVDGVMQLRQGRLPGTERQSWPATGGRNQAGTYPSDPASIVLPDHFKMQMDLQPERKIDENAFSALINWDIGGVTLRANLGYFDYEEFRLTDSDFSQNPTLWGERNPNVKPPTSNGPGYWDQCWDGPSCGLAAGQRVNSKAYQADVNLNSNIENKLQWTLGFYYYDDSGDGDTSSEFVWGYTDSLNPQTIAWAHWLYQGNGGTKSTAIYGQAEYSFTERTRATLGIRYSTDERNFFNKYINWNSTVPAEDRADPSAKYDEWPTFIETPRSVSGAQKGDASHPDWKFAVQHDFSSDVMVYASAATGYIAGRIAGGGSTDLTDPNEVETYEVGMKSTLLDGSMRLNLAAYYSDYSGLSSSSFVAQGQTIVAVATVSGAMTAMGLEAEMSWMPIDGLNIVAGLSLNDSELENFNQSILNRIFRDGGDAELRPGSLPPGAPCDQNCSQIYYLDGKTARFSPDYTFALDVSYEFGLGDWGRLVPGIYVYSSGDYKTTNIEYFFTQQDAYTSVDLRATWYAQDWPLSVQAFMLNATDEEYLIGGDQFSQGRAIADFSDPRTWGVRVAWNF